MRPHHKIRRIAPNSEQFKAIKDIGNPGPYSSIYVFNQQAGLQDRNRVYLTPRHKSMVNYRTVQLYAS